MKKTYTLTTDWAKDAGEHIPVIWHNDPNSSFTIDCEESIEELKEHVLNEVKKNADTSKAIVFRGFTEETIFDTNVNMYVVIRVTENYYCTCLCKTQESFVSNLVGFLLAGRFKARNHCKFGIKSGILLVLG